MFDDTDVIYSHTRAQAIADGVLVDVSATARHVFPGVMRVSRPG